MKRELSTDRYIQKDLRFIINFLVYSNITIIIVYSTIVNPIHNSLSMIGNRHEFHYLYYFILWSIYFSLSTYFIVMKLYERESYTSTRSITLLRLSVIILIVTTLIPARLEMPVLRGIHIGFSIIYIIVFALSFHPFIRRVLAREKRIRIVIHLWMILIWPGSIVVLLIVGWNAIYQLSYFINVLLLLLLISRIVFQFGGRSKSTD